MNLRFDYIPSIKEYVNFGTGAFIGLFTFSFIGLTVSFTSIKQREGQSLVNLVYFLMLFTSEAFYVVGDFNNFIRVIGDILPLNSILSILRGEDFSIWLLLFWILTPTLLFNILFKRIKFKR